MFQLFQSKVATMPMSQAKTELEKDSSIKLIDVRTPQEYQSGHIKGSINVPLDHAQEIEEIVSDKNEKIFVYCLSGGRSQQASNYFSKLGYTDITNIGGIASWTGDLAR